jgi:putative addiction module component (TIGR02574 family)
MASEKDIRDGALSLPLEKRAALARELLESLDAADADPAASEAWAKVIEQRAREVDDGTAELVEWEAVQERLSARWRR